MKPQILICRSCGHELGQAHAKICEYAHRGKLVVCDELAAAHALNRELVGMLASVVKEVDCNVLSQGGFSSTLRASILELLAKASGGK